LVSANTDVVANTSKVGYTEALVSANTDVVANTSKVGYTEALVSANTDVVANTSKVGYTEALVSANTDVVANTSKVGITTAQANAIIANTASVGMSNSTFFESYTFSSGGATFENSTVEETLGTFNVEEGGYVGVYLKLNLSLNYRTTTNSITLEIWNGDNQIIINTVDDLYLSITNTKADEYKVNSVFGHFYVEDNTTLTIKGIYSSSGYSNYQGGGWNYGNFKVGIYR
jgi:hypothetical protein